MEENKYPKNPNNIVWLQPDDVLLTCTRARQRSIDANAILAVVLAKQLKQARRTLIFAKWD
ncbi:MAG: hypothetical protein DMG38_21640 [Acidobacteria bacterium]|nr:MAG: hypothetical protein DMG38_21640 [Acidobacteriota bacterium]